MGLAPYTMVLLADGSVKRAEDVVSGDVLLDPLAGCALPAAGCLGGPGVGMTRVCAEGGVILDLTGDQPLLTDSGMLAAAAVVPGSNLRTTAGFARCVSVEPLMGDYMVYDLTLSPRPASSFIAANTLVVAVGGAG